MKTAIKSAFMYTAITLLWVIFALKIVGIDLWL